MVFFMTERAQHVCATYVCTKAFARLLYAYACASFLPLSHYGCAIIHLRDLSIDRFCHEPTKKSSEVINILNAKLSRD